MALRDWTFLSLELNPLFNVKLKNNWKIQEPCRNIQSKAPAVGTGTSLEGLSHLLEVLVSGPDTLLEGRFERRNQLSLLDSVV